MSIKKSFGLMAMAAALSGGLDGFSVGSKDKTRLNDIDFTPKKPPIPKGCKFYWFTIDGNGEYFDFIPQRIPDFVVYKTIASSHKVAFNKFTKWKQSQVVS